MNRSAISTGRRTAGGPHLGRAAAAAVTLIMTAVVLSPVLRTPPRDSFPLSTFPMFSSLIEPVVDIDYVTGVDAQGFDVTLNPEAIAGTDEVIVAGSIVSQAVRAGGSSLEGLCDAVAERVADDLGLRTIEVRTDVIDAVKWFQNDRQPISTTVHWRCDVG